MKFFVLTLLLLSSVVTNAVASPYIGFGIGSTQYDVDLTSLGGGTFDDSGTGTKIYAGYSFNDYVAAELAYYNFAEASVSTTVLNVTANASAEAKGIAAYAVASYPVSKKIKLAVKLGVLDWNADLRVNNRSASTDGTDLAYGILASYAFTKQLNIVAEWESFETDSPELALFSVGFKFDFK